MNSNLEDHLIKKIWIVPLSNHFHIKCKVQSHKKGLRLAAVYNDEVNIIRSILHDDKLIGMKFITARNLIFKTISSYREMEDLLTGEKFPF